MPKKQTEWIQLVKQTYAKGKKANKNYKFSTALKDAKKMYKKKYIFKLIVLKYNIIIYKWRVLI